MNSTTRKRKRLGLIAAATAAALMIGAAPSVTLAAPHGDRGNDRGDRGRQSQRYDSRDHSRNDRSSRHDDHRDHSRRGYSGRDYNRRDRHDHHNKGSFNLSFLFGRPRVYTNTHARVWVPGRWTTTVVPAVYDTRYDHCGRVISRVLIRAPQTTRIWVPGHYTDACSHGCCSGGAHAHGVTRSTGRIVIGGRF